MQPAMQPGYRAPAPAPTQRQWLRHDRRTPNDPADDFLVAPELAIGDVLSASTNRTRTGWRDTGHAKAARRGAAILGGLLGCTGGLMAGLATRDFLIGLGMWQLNAFGGTFALIGSVGGTIAGVVLGMLIAWIQRRPQSTFVGTSGLERYTRGTFFGPKLEVLRFDDASELKVQRTRHLRNGVYTGSTFDYAWRDRSGAVRFRIAGGFRDDRPIEADEPIMFAYAAEEAWSKHRIEHFRREIAQTGMARFACGRDFIGVGPHFLEVAIGDKRQRISTRDGMKQIAFEQGMLVIKETGAKEGWFSSEGVYRFSIATIADFEVFVRVLREQTGIEFR
jgi:hypothetical protein